MKASRFAPRRLISCSPISSRRTFLQRINSPQAFTTLAPHGQIRSQSTSTSTGNVDPTEVSHFSALASSWWDPHGPSRVLHLMNPHRHRFIVSCLTSAPPAPGASPPKLDYLDIGCGGGIFAESAARIPSVRSVTAIDPTPGVLDVARAHQRKDPKLLEPGRLDYRDAAIENLPVPASAAEQKDVVTVFEVIEHVPDPSAFLDAVARHVKPGGWLVLSTIARTWTSWAVTKVLAEHVMRIVPRGTHDWQRYINPGELADWFSTKAEWESPRIMGVVYVPGLGWKEIKGSEDYGNYFFGVRKAVSAE